MTGQGPVPRAGEPASAGVGLNRRILRLAIPNILAAVSTPLIGIADTAMVGHLEQVAFLGAVAAASAILDVLYWGAGFLRMGTTALVAHHYGAGDRRACAATLYRALLLALLCGGLMAMGRGAIGRTGFALAGGSAAVAEAGQQYLAVRLLGAPLVLGTLVLNGFFLGTANALAALWVTMVANVVNIGGDYVLIFGQLGAPRLGLVGAAWAAVLGNAAALAMGAGMLVWRYRPYLLQRVGRLLLAAAPVRQLMATSGHLFGRTLCLLLAQFAMLGMVARMGEVPLAASAVVWQVWALVSFGVDGFAHAAETLVGNALGAGIPELARALARRVVRWGLAVGVVFAVVYAGLLGPIAAAFTEHAAVARTAASLRWIIAPVQPLNAVVFVFDGILIGANDVRYLFRAMATAVLVLYLPAAAVLVYGLGWGLHGAWLAYAALMLGRFLTLLPRYRGAAWARSFLRAAPSSAPD